MRLVLQAFEDTYKREFGFVLESRDIIVDDLRVRATGKVAGPLSDPLCTSMRPQFCPPEPPRAHPQDP